MGRGTILTTITTDGTKRYKTILRINGRQQWRTWDKKSEAEGYLDSLSSEVRIGAYREVKESTFEEYVGLYQQTHLIPENYKPSTYKSYRSIIEHHLLPEFKRYTLQSISLAEINLFKARLLKKGRNRKTVRNVLIILGAILAAAIGDNFLRSSPMVGLKLPKIDRKQKGRTLKPDEIQNILQACDPEMHLEVATAIATGMRRSEQFALDWKHIDWEKNTIKVERALYWQYGKYHDRKPGDKTYQFTKPKSEESEREIDLSPELRKELRARYLKSGKKGLIFATSNGTPISPENVTRRSFYQVLEKAEKQRVKDSLPPIGKVRWHDLRHTFGSLKIDQGEDIVYVSAQMGHSKVSVTADIYAHKIRSRRPEAAAKTDVAIFGK